MPKLSVEERREWVRAVAAEHRAKNPPTTKEQGIELTRLARSLCGDAFMAYTILDLGESVSVDGYLLASKTSFSVSGRPEVVISMLRAMATEPV